VQSRDPVTFAAVAVLLLAVTVAACLGPMWRAGRVNPASALRTEKASPAARVRGTALDVLRCSAFFHSAFLTARARRG
jgi:hypothetical protein